MLFAGLFERIYNLSNSNKTIILVPGYKMLCHFEVLSFKNKMMDNFKLFKNYCAFKGIKKNVFFRL